MANLLTKLLEDPDELNKLKINAHNYGLKITWPKTGEKYVALTENILKQKPRIIVKKENIIDLLTLPPFSLTHINRLTDDTGIIQHAKFGIPNLKEGYCLDDNSRALLMVLMAYRQMKDVRGARIISHLFKLHSLPAKY